MGRKNKGSGKSELKAKVTGLLTVILFAASKVLSHAFSCFESHRNFGGIESRYYLYFIEKKTEKTPTTVSRAWWVLDVLIRSFIPCATGAQ